MLRPRDFLLTFGAFCLLLAALDVRPRVIRASAASAPGDVASSAEIAATTAAATEVAGEENWRKADDFGSVMNKIKKNLESREPQQLQQQRTADAMLAPSVNNKSPLLSSTFMEQKYGDKRHNSYNYYANETATTNEKPQQPRGKPAKGNSLAPRQQQHQAQEVQVEFLRSVVNHTLQGVPSVGPNQVSKAPSSPYKSSQQQQHTTLYLLTHYGNSPPSKQTAPAMEAWAASLDNEIDVGEQQQQPPFTLYPPFNQQQQPAPQLPGQLPAQLGGLSPITQQNIRNILSNYQRTNPQLAALGQQFAQQQLAQRLQAGGGSSDQQQALLRNLLQQVGQQQPIGKQVGGQQQAAAAPARSPAPTPAVAARPGSTPAAQQQLPAGQQQPFSPLQLITAPFQAFLPGLAGSGGQPGSDSQLAGGGRIPGQPQQRGGNNSPAQTLGGLFNPFGAAQNGAGGQAAGQQQGLPNLQALYQQSPIYQALLAARQRQEALQAAEKLRQQQQRGALANSAGPSGGGARRPAYGGSTVTGHQQGPAGNSPQPGQQQPSPHGNRVDVSNNNDNQQQQQGYANPLPAQPQPAQRPSPVKFDDDNDNNNSGASSGSGEPNNEPVGSGNAGQDQNDNQTNNDQSDNGGGGGDSGGSEPSNEGNGGANGKAEEEDPDLKQFQNLANGGDSFTDLFPPGILSNHDISDIKKQQEEQAKKQENEQRQRQQQHQHQHQNQNQNQDHQQQPENAQQPINQFGNDQQQQQPAPERAGAGADQSSGNGGGQEENNNSSNGAPEENGNEGGAGDNNSNAEDAGDNGEGGGSQDDSGGQDDSDQGGDGGNGDEENPTAAALTAKSSDNSGGSGSDKAEGKRFSESPGVEYAR